MVTVAPTMGIDPDTDGSGILKTVVSPTFECVEVKLPVQLKPPQSAVQSTPRFAGSPATVADRVTAEPAGAVAGGGWVIVTLVT